LRTGLPRCPFEQTNLSNTYSASQRPNVLREPRITGDRSRGEMLAEYFDTSAFQAPGAGVFGNSPRSPGFGPGYVGIDASIHKQWTVKERVGLQFHSDFYNLPNRPNFSVPAAVRGRTDFGRIASIAPGTDGRLIQLGLRIEF
jgi:hypothetical protein